MINFDRNSDRADRCFPRNRYLVVFCSLFPNKKWPTVHESTRVLYRVPLVLPPVSSYISFPLVQNVLTIQKTFVSSATWFRARPIARGRAALSWLGEVEVDRKIPLRAQP